MCAKCYFFTFQILSFVTGFQYPFIWTWIAIILSFHLTIAQIENNNPSFNFPSNNNEDKSLFQPSQDEIPYLKDNFMDKSFDMTDPRLNNKGPKINMEDQEKFLDPGEIYLSKLKGKGVEAGKDPNKYRANQFMGDYRVEGNKARIIFRDHEYPDGDRVRILHNDRVIKHNVLLVERFVGLTVELVPGFNKIDFIALNQGTSGPNTAEVRVYDEVGDMTAANQWNLATGVKATYILIKE